MDVRIVRIDGTSTTGRWMGSTDGRALKIRTSDGDMTLRLDELSVVAFLDTKRSAPTRASATFHLADGGRLFGALIDPKEAGDNIFGVTALGDPTVFPFDRLAAVELASRKDFPLAVTVFDAILAARRPGKDLLITRERAAYAGSDDDPQTVPPRQPEPAKSVAGQLISLGRGEGTFVFGDRQRVFQLDRMFGVVLATGVWDASSHVARRAYPVRVELHDGSTLAGRIERADEESIQLATSLNALVSLELDHIAALTITSDRVVYVSDLDTAAQATEGILHRPWAPQFDKSVTGGPISIEGRLYERGLGVHSRTELTFEIDGDYESFVATLGIDDAVRPRGSVVFRVVGDGRILYESGTVTGKDDPIDIRVDIAGVKKLQLIVDFGQGLDLADHADWADARLLKPAPSVDAKTQ